MEDANVLRAFKSWINRLGIEEFEWTKAIWIGLLEIVKICQQIRTKLRKIKDLPLQLNLSQFVLVFQIFLCSNTSKPECIKTASKEVKRTWFLNKSEATCGTTLPVKLKSIVSFTNILFCSWSKDLHDRNTLFIKKILLLRLVEIVIFLCYNLILI